MIQVTRLNNTKFMVNAEMIQSLQATPDTVIRFNNRETVMVKEPVEELSKKIANYHRLVHHDFLT